jgi:hypothetical protein
MLESQGSSRLSIKEKHKVTVGTFFGYAIKMTLPADHTYVTSDRGHVWPCWGRFAGGNLICMGQGNLDEGDCLSQPNSEAGINYGVTGVCHQTANRILYPSRLLVSRASGYIGSVFAWGTYGRHGVRLFSPSTFPWPELRNCRSSHIHP